MGAILYSSGSEKSLHTKDACFMVAAWLHDHYEDTRPYDEQMGDWDFPPEAVVAANAAVPLAFEEAKEAGHVPSDFFDDWPQQCQPQWEYARRFIMEAAESGQGISGSF